MISLPAGFDHAELVDAFGAVGAYVVGAYVLILAAGVLYKALNGGGNG